MFLLSSRKFWLALVALAVVIVQAVVPTFAIDQTLFVDGAVILVAYIVSLALDPGTPGEKLVSMLTSRRFWLTLFSTAFLVVQAFFPQYQIDTEAMTGFVVIIVAMVVGLAIDPGDPAAKWTSLLKSRKFYTAIVSLAVLLLNSFHLALPFDLTPDQLIQMCVIAGGYIAAVAFEGKLSSMLPQAA